MLPVFMLQKQGHWQTAKFPPAGVCRALTPVYVLGGAPAGLNIKVFEPLAHRASKCLIQVIKQNDTPENQIANLKYFHLPHRASGYQVLLAPNIFLLAPGKWAMLNVEPCTRNRTVFFFRDFWNLPQL